jgi:hypothetical protein
MYAELVLVIVSLIFVKFYVMFRWLCVIYIATLHVPITAVNATCFGHVLVNTVTTIQYIP